MKKKLLFFTLILFAISVSVIAQPTVLGTQLVGGSYATYDLTLRGSVRYVRLQATSGASSGARNWEFASGTAASTNYSINWRPYGSGLTLSGYNTLISPVGGTASALYNTASGGQSGLLPAVVSGSYYTVSVGTNSSSNNSMSILQTTYNPKTIDWVTRDVNTPAVNGSVVVSCKISAALSTNEQIWLRYSTDGFTTSNFVQFGSFTNLIATATIPASANTTGNTVQYYVLSTDGTYPALTHSNADYLTLNLNNNNSNATNYSYTVASSATTSTTNNTIAIDGSYSDWRSSELLNVNGNSGLFLTWDATYVYVSFRQAYSSTDKLNIAFVTTNLGTNYTSTTPSFSGRQFKGYLTPNYIVQSSGNTSLALYTLASNSWGAGSNIYNSTELYRFGSDCEFRISRSSLGLTGTSTPFAVYGWYANNTDATYAAFGSSDNFTSDAFMRSAFAFTGAATGVSPSTDGFVDYNGTQSKTMNASLATGLRNLYVSDATTTLGSNTTITGNVTIASSATLDADNTNNRSLTLSGNWTNSGTFQRRLGTVLFAGTSNQSITNASQENFYNLVINNSAGVTLVSPLTITGTLTPTSGTLTTNSNLTIAPNGVITSNYGNLNGSVILQQNIIAQRGWRVFANPFTTATTIASTASTNGIAISTTADPNSNLTDSRTFSNATNTWSNVTASTWAANTPYSLFIRGLSSEVTGSNYTGGPTAFTYNVSGTLNSSSVGVTPTSTSNFIIVGNPYAAPVNTNALTGQISNTPYYTYQITQGGNQTAQRTKAGAWVASGSTSNTTNTIPVLGVLAYQPASTSTFNITTGDINTSGTLQSGLFGLGDVTKQVELVVEKSGDYQDKLFVRQDNNATSSALDRLDLKKLYNDNVNVYTINTAESQRLAVDARAAINGEIPLGISGLVGNYNFKLANNNLDNATVYLTDKQLSTTTELKVGDTYNFSITTDAASKGENRFVLNFTQKAIATIADATGFSAKVLGNVVNGKVTVQIVGSTTPISIKVVDISGKTLKTVNAVNGTNTIELGKVAAGVTVLQISNGTNTVTEKVVSQ